MTYNKVNRTSSRFKIEGSHQGLNFKGKSFSIGKGLERNREGDGVRVKGEGVGDGSLLVVEGLGLGDTIVIAGVHEVLINFILGVLIVVGRARKMMAYSQFKSISYRAATTTTIQSNTNIGMIVVDSPIIIFSNEYFSPPPFTKHRHQTTHHFPLLHGI